MPLTTPFNCSTLEERNEQLASFEELPVRTYSFKVTLEAEDDGRWSAWLTSYPACGAWGDTKSEALDALADMTAVFLEVMADAGEPVYADSVDPFDVHNQVVELGGKALSGTASVNNESISIPVSA